MNKVKTNKISKYALSLIAVATLSCSSLSFGMDIFQAIKKNDPKRVAEILKDTSFNANKADNKGLTPLYWACLKNNLDIVTLLLNHGAKKSINKANNYCWTPLHWACVNNNLEIVELLLKYGADANIANDDGDTPLIWACYNNNLDIVTLLLDHGAKESINKADNNYGWTPLYLACEKNNLEIVELLLDHGAKESINIANNNHGSTPLIWACEKNNLDIVKLLLDHDADANKANNDCWTPLNIACGNNNLDIVTLLLESGAKESINIADNNYGWTPLNWACEKNNLEIVKLLLKYGADANIANKSGETPLYLACRKDNPRIVELLLNHGADVDQESLKRAKGKPEVLELLTFVQNYDEKIKTGEYYRLPKGKENDENDAEKNKKLLAFVDELNETRKKIILNKLKKELPGQLKQNKEKKIKKFGNVEFKYQDNSKDDNKATEFQVSEKELKEIQRKFNLKK
jgi:ankyrin repeat protein